MGDINLITTSDGSHSLLSTVLNETYHSVHGAIQESQHVFIRNGLAFWHSQNKAMDLRILEIGFGTGLNALLTFQNAGSVKTYYESWEAYPLPPSVIRRLNHGQLLNGADVSSEIHEAAWNLTVNLDSVFSLNKRHADILMDSLNGPFDLIFFDAFAPAKQPEMWTLEALKKVTGVLSPGGVFVTYCAKGQVKRDLTALGLKVETLPGPPGKKEMIRASRSKI